jgi:small subunit ribosomal protein S20
MANHKSAIKRIRANNSKRLHNRYFAKSTRTAVKNLRAATEKKEAESLLPKVSAMLDKLAKRNVIHKNKASNLKSKLTKKVNSLKK